MSAFIYSLLITFVLIILYIGSAGPMDMDGFISIVSLMFVAPFIWGATLFFAYIYFEIKDGKRYDNDKK